ncbi:MAG: hypothetical protein JO314_06775 [Acidobacteria bacterium]|nr:hypothetical protein [Acidobacteriota bacterium]
MNIERQKQLYIEQATRTAIIGFDESSENDREARLRFWQSLTSNDRMMAMTEIVRRVHIAGGGDEADLKVNRSIAKFVKR